MSLLAVLGALGLLVALALVAIATYAVWRMTVAHERIERHVATIERQLAARPRDGGA
jgi:hypothetical protein